MSNYPIFSVLGIEIEYMLVDHSTLQVQPKSDLLLHALAGEQVNSHSLGDIAISNELVMHVLEFKNDGPKPFNAPIAEQFQQAINDLQPTLQENQLMFLPTGAHPWMDPHRETVRWPHDNHTIYQQYDTIFNCQGHGWSNLQSMHVNLPYATDNEFCELHTLIRLLLPALPALAASSPILDNKATGLLDSRLYFYGQNQQRIPSISGDIIPEFIASEQAYQLRILEPMYKAIHPFDPDGVLQHPWLNSRAAIPKFDQKAVEIRILDTQECVNADIAIAKVIFALLKKWYGGSRYFLDHPCDTKLLKLVYDEAIKNGLSTPVDSQELAKQWQLPRPAMTLRAIWSHWIEQVSTELSYEEQFALEQILSLGNLSERILQAVGKNIQHESLKDVYAELGHCLLSNEQFAP